MSNIENRPAGPQDRDFGDSAGYGTGGSTLDYRDLLPDERPVRPNPLDAVMGPRGGALEAEGLARALGWFSIGLGLAEILGAERIGRALGMEDRAGVIRLFGLREVATGAGLLSGSDPAPWIWGRLAGDAMDLTALGSGLSPDNPRQENVGMAIAAVAGVSVLDAVCAYRLTASR